MKHSFFILFIGLFISKVMLVTAQYEEIVRFANDQFTAKMSQEIVKTSANKSFVLSAFSVLPPLTSLAMASNGASHKEIIRITGFSNINEAKEAFKGLNRKIQEVKGVELKQASKIYVRDGYSLNEKFAASTRSTFGLEAQSINFNVPQQAASKINTWVEDNTNKKIKNLVTPDSINRGTVAVLVNAIYFKGKWRKKFREEQTKPRDFYVSKVKKISVPTMYQLAGFRYSNNENLDAKILEMLYEGNETSLVIVLPNEKDGIDDLMLKLQNPSALRDSIKTTLYIEVEVQLPKFKIETTTNLKDVLKNMGIKKLFNSREAKLDNLFTKPGNYSISDATQKAFIEVNEEGAEAAAANQFAVAEFSDSAIPIEPEQFVADHAFAFYLMFKDIILFNGVVRTFGIV